MMRKNLRIGVLTSVLLVSVLIGACSTSTAVEEPEAQPGVVVVEQDLEGLPDLRNLQTTRLRLKSLTMSAILIS